MQNIGISKKWKLVHFKRKVPTIDLAIPKSVLI